MSTKTEINVIIDNNHYKAPAQDLTGLELKALAAIAPANLLFREVHGPDDDELIQNDSIVHLHAGDHFYDMPPGNFGDG